VKRIDRIKGVTDSLCRDERAAARSDRSGEIDGKF
jgi:hypothetical protein